MHYTLSNGDRIDLPAQNTVSILARIGVRVIDETPGNGSGENFLVDFSGVQDMRSFEVGAFVDPFRGGGSSARMMQGGNGKQIEIATSNGDFRDIAARVAGQAIELLKNPTGTLNTVGAAFEEQVRLLATTTPGATIQPEGSPIRQQVTAAGPKGMHPVS